MFNHHTQMAWLPCLEASKWQYTLVLCIYILCTCHDQVNKNLITLSLLLQAIHIMQAKNQVVTGTPRMLSSCMLTMTYCMAQKFNGNFATNRKL